MENSLEGRRFVMLPVDHYCNISAVIYRFVLNNNLQEHCSVASYAPNS